MRPALSKKGSGASIYDGFTRGQVLQNHERRGPQRRDGGQREHRHEPPPLVGPGVHQAAHFIGAVKPLPLAIKFNLARNQPARMPAPAGC
jgi:hypothetical protein